MSYSQLPSPRFVVYDLATGDPLSGGFVYTYVPGGETPATTYQNQTGSVENTNPIVLDSAGSCLIYGNGSYQLTVTDALGNAVPGYSGITYSPPFVSEAMQPVVAATTVTEAFDLLAVNGGTIGGNVLLNGDLTIVGTADVGTISLDTPLTVPDGGTGTGTLAANAILIGNGTDVVSFLLPGTIIGDVLTTNGTVAEWGPSSQIANAIFTETTSWVSGAGVTQVKAIVIGGGGGGSFVDACCVMTDFQGGFGGLAIGLYDIAAEGTYELTIGNAGTGSSGGIATAGSISSFSTLASATGGTGATSGSNGTNGTGTGGTIRNTYAGNAAGIFNGSTSGATGIPPYVWTINSAAAAGVGGVGAKGGTGGLVYLEWIT